MAVAGAARGHQGVMALGLGLSILPMGLAAIVVVAGRMIRDGARALRGAAGEAPAAS